MALIGSAPALRCSCSGTLLVGKDVQPLQGVNPIRIAVSTVLDESQCGHITSVWVWDVCWCELFFGLSVWLCAWAIADGESDSYTVVFSKQLIHFGYEIWFAKTFSKMNPYMSK
jgi:hypothetical protein